MITAFIFLVFFVAMLVCAVLRLLKVAAITPKIKTAAYTHDGYVYRRETLWWANDETFLALTGLAIIFGAYAAFAWAVMA